MREDCLRELEATMETAIKAFADYYHALQESVKQDLKIIPHIRRRYRPPKNMPYKSKLYPAAAMYISGVPP